MSNPVINLVLSKKVGSPVRKSILLIMANRAGDDGSGIWSSKQRIAAEVECGLSTVYREIDKFVAEGILVEMGHRPCRGGATVNYSIDLRQVEKLPARAQKDDASISELSHSGNELSHSGNELSHSGNELSHSGTLTTLEPSFNLSLTRESAKDEIQSAFDAWNELAERAGLTKAQKMTKSRKQKMAARLRDVGGLAGWHDALAMVEASPFLTGQVLGTNGSSFVASLDFVLSEEKFTKIMEKQYAERSDRNGADGRGRMAHVEQTGRREQRAFFAGQVARRRLENGK